MKQTLFQWIIRLGMLYISNQNQNRFEITNIWIRQLVEDADVFKNGFDSEDCEGTSKSK